ncbi:MAG: hypothetical protein BWY70_00986 [Bacteroidetes bacterium ADurb.Bin408]|nr:MAG: hypothetical protein BWY70_00986 [Bacteroidetes bacterium ADurb.Bin408]
MPELLIVALRRRFELKRESISCEIVLIRLIGVKTVAKLSVEFRAQGVEFTHQTEILLNIGKKYIRMDVIIAF